jgi:hypothetical protein
MKDFARFALVLLLAACATARGQEQPTPNPYPTMAPLGQYLMASAADEIRLARSAAPPSISAHAEVLVLGKHGYYIAVKGDNGFVCFVGRQWFSDEFSKPVFWNPKTRGPECMNPPAARSVLPQFLVRAQWVLAGATRQQLIDKTKDAFASHRFATPAPASFSFMLSKEGYFADAGGPWLPHVMPYVPHGQAAEWGAGLPGSPVQGGEGSLYMPTVLYIPVRRWSDGSPGPPPPVLH